MNFIFYILFLYSNFSWGLTTSHMNIEEITIDDHFVQILLNENLVCGGAVVSKRYVLTAGHCIYDEDPQDYLVKIDGHNFSVKDLIVHEDYEVYRPQFHFDGEYFTNDQGAYFDIGLIELNIPIDSETYESIKINLVDVNLDYDSFTIYVGGWGRINTDGDEPENIRLTNQAYVVKKSTDRDLLKRNLYGPIPGPGGRTFDHYRFWQKSSHLYIDFIDDETQVCRGDSGSPIFAANKNETLLIGIVSSSVDWRCGKHRSNALFSTDIMHNLNWIKYNIN